MYKKQNCFSGSCRSVRNLDLTMVSSKIELKDGEKERSEGETERKQGENLRKRQNWNSVITQQSPKDHLEQLIQPLQKNYSIQIQQKKMFKILFPLEKRAGLSHDPKGIVVIRYWRCISFHSTLVVFCCNSLYLSVVQDRTSYKQAVSVRK